jgi:hypothetical protein
LRFSAANWKQYEFSRTLLYEVVPFSPSTPSPPPPPGDLSAENLVLVLEKKEKGKWWESPSPLKKAHSQALMF